MESITIRGKYLLCPACLVPPAVPCTEKVPPDVTYMSCALCCSWIPSWIASSSDSRIKEGIEDINDDSALQMILVIEPKTYKNIDKVAKGDKKVYGFIAQQIR